MTPPEDTGTCLLCSEPSQFGCHGVRDGEVYSVWYCRAHYAEVFKQREETEQECIPNS